MKACVVAIDPGGTTGVAVMLLTDTAYEVLETYQWGDPDTVWEPILELITRLSYEYDDLTVLCESFELRPDVWDPDETPKFIIKDLDRYVAPYIEIVYQQASQAKVGCPPAQKGRRDRLAAFGLKQTHANRHCGDALRHIVVYAIEKLRHRPLIIAGWGKPGKK